MDIQEDERDSPQNKITVFKVLNEKYLSFVLIIISNNIFLMILKNPANWAQNLGLNFYPFKKLNKKGDIYYRIVDLRKEEFANLCKGSHSLKLANSHKHTLSQSNIHNHLDKKFTNNLVHYIIKYTFLYNSNNWTILWRKIRTENKP